MNCVLLAQMDKVFSKKEKKLKILGKMENNPVLSVRKSGNQANAYSSVMKL